MNGRGERLRGLIEASAGAGTADVADEVLAELNECAGRGDVEAGEIVQWMARDGLVAYARKVRSRARIPVKIGAAVHQMRAFVNARVTRADGSQGYQTFAWQLLPADDLREVRRQLAMDVAVNQTTIAIFDFGLELIERHSSANARDALIAAGLDPSEFAVG